MVSNKEKDQNVTTYIHKYLRIFSTAAHIWWPGYRWKMKNIVGMHFCHFSQNFLQRIAQIKSAKVKVPTCVSSQAIAVSMTISNT